MTLDEAIEAFEKDFTVSADAGHAYDDTRPDALDMSRAPNGESYVTLTSGGLKAEAERSPAFYTTEEAAVSAWLNQAWSYAESQGGKVLWWRERPEYIEAEYIAVNQMAAMLKPKTRMNAALTLGYVYSRLLVSKSDEKEAEK